MFFFLAILLLTSISHLVAGRRDRRLAGADGPAGRQRVRRRLGIDVRGAERAAQRRRREQPRPGETPPCRCDPHQMPIGARCRGTGPKTPAHVNPHDPTAERSRQFRSNIRKT